MQIATTLDRARVNAYEWRRDLSIPRKLALAFGIAALVGLLAQVRVPTPWSPVPITGQTFGVLLAGVLLGTWWGGLSMALYGGLGLLGVPWFTGWAAGTVVSGGYIVGFVVAALFLGYMTDKFAGSRQFGKMLGLMLIASMVFVYVPGVIWLKFWLNVDLAKAISLGITPFVIGDIIKAVLAAGAARGMLPKPK